MLMRYRTKMLDSQCCGCQGIAATVALLRLFVLGCMLVLCAHFSIGQTDVFWLTEMTRFDCFEDLFLQVGTSCLYRKGTGHSSERMTQKVLERLQLPARRV